MTVDAETQERFWAKVNKAGPGECWLWTASTDAQGYGKFGVAGPQGWARAHRVAYEMLVGEIPAGLVIDHLCRTTSCVNPGHMEPVTRRVNVLRGTSPAAQLARRTSCPQGHPYTPESTYYWRGHRRCRTCNRAAAQRLRDIRRGSRKKYERVAV